MASVVSHPAVPIALAVALGSGRVPPALTAVACGASVLPDLDSVGFMAAVPYGHPLGHRGFTHSLLFALVVACLCIPLARHLGASPSLTLVIVVSPIGVGPFLSSWGLRVLRSEMIWV